MKLTHKIEIAILLTTTILQAGSIAQEKIQALNTLKTYSKTTACGTNFDDPDYNTQDYLKNVFLIDRDPSVGSATYYILWQGDLGCMGGNGSTASIVSKVSRSDYDRLFLLQNNNAFGKVFYDHVVGTIDSMQQINSRKFVVFSSKLGKNG